MEQQKNAGLTAATAAATGNEAKPHLLDRYSSMPKDDSSDSPYYKSQAPVIELPKGGGALKGIDEKFTVNAVNGTSSLQVNIPMSPGRNNFTPALSLQYNSGSGNTEFGLGWALSLPSIQRKTDKKLPVYDDENESDVFLLAGAEDLVPLLDGGVPVIHTEGSLLVKRYIPRIEGLYARIEHILETDTSASIQGSWWRVTTKDNIVTFYGLNSTARISDPQDARRIFKWLPQFSYDRKGNVQVYEYKAEDMVNVPLTALHEKNRSASLLANTYLKAIHHCNNTPWDYEEETDPYQPTLPVVSGLGFLFKTVFDYGDEYIALEDDEEIPEEPPVLTWPYRTDAFSDFHAGFDIRTYRKCRRVLIFHNIEDLENQLVRSLDIIFAQDGEADYVEADYITNIIQSGYTLVDDDPVQVYRKKSLPALSFQHNPLNWDLTWHDVSPADVRNAPQGLSGPYQWIDLWGEGLPGILTEQGNGWFYKQNNGDGHFTPALQVAEKPSFQGLGAKLQWEDLDADGRRQLVSREGYAPGYYELNDDQQWLSFRAFEQNVNIDWESPYTKMLDLDGDGRADLLLTDDMVWTWFSNKGTKGYETGGRNSISFNEEEGPRLLLNDKVQSVFLADMNGDGLTDIVRIKNGEVCYWPNMGYGRFGMKVAMTNAPWFDNPELFNPIYITLADVSGTGAADIIYLGGNGCKAYINLAGNALSDAVDITAFPGVEPFSKVAVLDFVGNGTGCIVWSSPLPQHAHAPMRYIDLMGGNKPYLMTSYRNGMGKTVTVTYKSSTKYYLDDRENGTPWATRLPFPVHCVDTITTQDNISETSYTQSYTYHHGYYDHEEREFRGFGRVDSIDSDIAEVTESPLDDLEQVPVLTKSWYHTGAWMREQVLIDAFALEYFNSNSWPQLPQILEMQAGMTAIEQREAHRALKGLPLRQEVYAMDGDALLGDKPYTVTAFAYCVEKLQDREPNRHAVFYAYQQHKVTYNCERIVTDPRIAHELTLGVDAYGNILQSAQVVYKRVTIPGTLPDVVEAAQARMYITYNSNTYTTAIEGDEHYLLPLPATTNAFELYIAPGDDFENYPDGLWTVADLLNSIPSGPGSDFSAPMSDTDVLRILGKTCTFYLADDASTELELGIAAPRALPNIQYTLAVTPDMLTAYGSPVDSGDLGTAGYIEYPFPELPPPPPPPPDPEPDPLDGTYWLPSGTMRYSVDSSDPKDSFFTPLVFSDPFINEIEVEYFSYLLPKSTKDMLDNLTEINSYDWRCLQPAEITDPNNNITQILYDALGMSVALALKGKGTEADYLLTAGGSAIVPDTGDDFDAQAAFWSNSSDPTTYAKALLGRATWRCIYNLDIEQDAVGVAMIARQLHYADDSDSDVLVRLTYTDGLGRVAMHKAQFAPDSGVPKWVGSGKTVYNNKGKVVMQYEPFLTNTHLYEPPFAGGVTPLIHYDPLGRLMRTDMPDASFTKTVWDAWRQEVWDNNDTLTTGDAWCMAHSSDPTTVTKALAHAKTPTVMHLDTLARPFYTIQYLEDYTVTTPDAIESYETLDIQGNRLIVTDGRAIDILLYNYDMLKSPMKQLSKDSGLRFMLLAVDGQQSVVFEMDGIVTPAVEREFNTMYDELRRPIEKWVDDGTPKMLEEIIYGEDETSPELKNLRGKLVTHNDGAGTVSISEYDFKGNPRDSIRTFTVTYTGHPDWNASPALEGTDYTTLTYYDALNRVIKITTPDGAETTHTYDEGGLLKAVAVDGVRGLDTDVINAIKYNAKGQRLKVEYENTATTEYEYDADTFRVTRIYTWRPDTPDDDDLQDLNYFYDPVGNITRQENNAEETIFFSNTIVSPDNYYTYDALYRLIKAHGREHAGGDTAPTCDDAARIDMHPPSESSAIVLRRYKQVYTYDAAGNMTQMKHRVDSTDSWIRDYTVSTTSNRTTGNTIGSKATGAETYTYDARGNITGGFNHLNAGGASMTYNNANRLETVIKNADITEYYQYDGNGQRVRKVNFNDDGDILKERKYIGSYEVYEESGGVADYKQETLHVMDDTARVMMIETELDPTDDSVILPQVIRYQYSNHLGTSALELDEEGVVISYEEYYPFGNTSFQSINDDISLKRYRFTGKERDEMSGFYYHGARYYVCWLGRWCGSDPINNDAYNAEKGNVGKNLKRNFLELAASSYEYCYDNPVTYNDPSGEQPPTGLLDLVKQMVGLDNINRPPENVQEAKYREAILTETSKAVSKVNEFKNDPGTLIAKNINATSQQKQLIAGGVNLTLGAITVALTTTASAQSGGATATGIMTGLSQMSIGLTQIVDATVNQDPKVSSASGIITFVAETHAHGQLDTQTKAITELTDFLLNFGLQRAIKGETPEMIIEDIRILFQKDVSFQNKVMQAASSASELKDVREAYGNVKVLVNNDSTKQVQNQMQQNSNDNMGNK